MKKVFLLFGISVFSSASAQQKDVFDMNRHIRGFLDKKMPSGKIANPPVTNQSISLLSPQTGFKVSPTLPNGNKVYTLGTDNMPCIVPDMGQFTIMPNISAPKEYFNSPLFKNNTHGTIPNVVTPYRLIATK